MDWDDDEPSRPQQTFIKRHPLLLGLGAVLLVSAVVMIVKLATSGGGSSRRDNIMMVSLPPPPPPPPQNTPPPPPPQDQKTEQPMIKEDAPKEAEPPKPAPQLGTGIKGNGPDGFGLGTHGNGMIGGSNNSKGTKWAGYASQVQARLEQALRSNRKTRSASLNVNVRIWPDDTGHVTRAQLSGSTGDPSLDTAIRDEVLGSLQLAPPPPDMPKPITLRLAARRP